MKEVNNKSETGISPLITDDEHQELFRELTTILSRRWINDDIEVFGVSKNDLLIVTRLDSLSLDNILEEYKQFISILGLELVSYKIGNDLWLCLRSFYFAPPELNKNELTVLGVIIGYKETGRRVTTKKVKDLLVSNDYLKEYQVNESLRSLARKGYITRKQSIVDYNYRTLLEFDEMERKKIKEEFDKL